MPNLPISQLPNLSGATNETLLAVVYSGDGSPITYHITLEDLIKSTPFGTMYQSWIPDVTDTYSIGDSGHTIAEIFVGSGTVFIGPNGSLGIDDNGVLFSQNGFATNFFVLGAVTESGVTTTSGVTFTVAGDEVIMEPVSGKTYNLNQQLIPTGGTIGDVFTQTGSTNYEWGWVAPSVAPYPVVYGLYSQTGVSQTITGTTEQSMINGGVGTLTVGANQFSVGDSFEAQFGGVITNGNNHTIRIRVKSGSVVLADSGNVTIQTNTNDVFSMTLNFAIRNIGSTTTASIYTLGTFQTAKVSTSGLSGFGFNGLNNSTFDTTISNTLDVTAEFGTDGDSLSVEFFRLMKSY